MFRLGNKEEDHKKGDQDIQSTVGTEVLYKSSCKYWTTSVDEEL